MSSAEERNTAVDTTPVESTAAGVTDLAASGALSHIGRYRWVICALLFFATTINYIDRQVLGILAPTLQKDIGWNEAQYGAIVSWFTFAYALGYLGAGRMMDRLGTRLGFSLSVIVWSLSAMAHSLVRTVMGFSLARFALGVGESGNFPASIKTIAEWALYGLTRAYVHTRNPELLATAERAADWFIAHLPPDGVPYWDFRHPDIPLVERDASAAAIAASGLIDLSRQSSGDKVARYRSVAEGMIRTLSSEYLTEGTALASILQHSVGGRPQNTEVDVGIVYADYYFIEALLRLRGIYLE